MISKKNCTVTVVGLLIIAFSPLVKWSLSIIIIIRREQSVVLLDNLILVVELILSDLMPVHELGPRVWDRDI